MVWNDYTWIFVCSIFLAFFVAWGIGANDVANAFGTSVGAKALTLRQAVIVASVLEFGGAVLLGSGVTDTIKSGIADVSYYTYQPELLMYGMLCALLAAGIWLALATFLELPVSTTHTIVGAIIGMSMVAMGPDSVVWTSSLLTANKRSSSNSIALLAAPPKSGSPFPGGVVSIILAWFITPAMAALCAAFLFTFTKVFVLHARQPFKRSLMLYPFYTFLTVWVITYFVIQKGVNGWMKSENYSNNCPAGGTAPAKNYKTNDEGEVKVTGCTIPDGTNAWISAVTAAVCTLICIVALKWVVKLVDRDMQNFEAAEAKLAGLADPTAAAEAGVTGTNGSPKKGSDNGTHEIPMAAPVPEPLTAAVLPRGPGDPSRTPTALQSLRRSKVWTSLAAGTNVDVHEITRTDEKVKAMHAEAEVFDLKTEMSFKYLQVLTACANSFAHGANDVANAIGSMAAVYAIWQCECANSKASVPIWMFVIGGVGLSVGLATYGYNIIRALGVRMTKLTNSRGYCAELTAAIIVIVASRYGFPVSTTQVITGAITGVGLLEVITAKIQGKPQAASRFNFLLLFKFFAGWVATLIIAALTAAAFTAQGIYAPGKNESDARAEFNAAFNETNFEIGQTLVDAGNVTAPTPAQQQALEWGITIQNATRELASTSGGAMLDPDSYLGIFQNGTWYLGNSTLQGVLPDAFQPVMPLGYYGNY